MDMDIGRSREKESQDDIVKPQTFKVLQVIKLNLFKLATGPIYNEFNIDFKGA